MGSTVREPLISVIVPVYKVEQYLNRCIDSIINQTYKNLEIILVDDGSPDNCPKICDEYADKDKRIKVIHKANGGLSSARNAGLDVATGEYISFVDSDDWLDLNIYSTLLAKSNNEDLILYDLNYIFPNNEIKNLSLMGEKNISINDENIDTIFNLFFSSRLGYSVNKLYKKSKLKKLRFCNIALREDLVFVIAFLNRIKSLKYIPICGYNYLQQSQSLLHQSNVKNVLSIDEFERNISVGVLNISKKNNQKLYNYMLLVFLTDILMRDVLRNQKLHMAEKAKYVKDIFYKPFIKKLKFRYCKNKLQIAFLLFAKLKMHNLFIKIFS